MIKHPAVYRPAVYRLYGADDELLYIGQTGGDLTGRLRAHRNKPWGSLIARREIEWHETPDAAMRAEAEAITQENPVYNVARPLPPQPRVRTTTRIPPLAGVQEISRMLAVNRQRVNQLAATRDFPLPVVTLKQGRVWVAADVEKWAHRHNRTVHDY